MSVKKDPSGRRSVQVEVEVPGTPEDVWRAIATGPGVSSWFVPTDIEERTGGAIAFHFNMGMDSKATVTGWDPPRCLAYEERDWAENAPPLATEVIVEARAGGRCIVRMVHSLFATGDEWDNQLESFESGWPGFFRVLLLYLTYFRGQPCSSIQISGTTAVPEIEAWQTLTRLLGLERVAEGQRSTASAHSPPLAGLVENIHSATPNPRLLLRLDQPASGVASVGAFSWGGNVHLSLNLYLYGDQAAAAATRDRPLWQAWMSEHFPSSNNVTEESPCP